MSEPYLDRLVRENAYLKLRCSQLESDLADVSAEAERLRQRLEHTHARREASRPNPLSGGQ